MAEQKDNQRFWKFTGVIMRAVFMFMCVATCLLLALLIFWLVRNTAVLVPSTENPVDLILKAMNIILVFFAAVVAFLAFFGYREATEHQRLRENLNKNIEKQQHEFEELHQKLSQESDRRTSEDRYRNVLNLVRIFHNLELYDKASYSAEEIKEPLTYELPLLKGLIKCQQERYGDALRLLEEASHLAIEPREKATVYFAKGKTYMVLEDYPRANSYYDKCIKLAPDYPDAYVNKAYICKRQNNNIDGAIELINKAIKINKKDSLCYFNRACYQSLKGDKDRMEQDLKTAISLDRKWVYHALVDKDLIRNQDVVRKILGL